MERKVYYIENFKNNWDNPQGLNKLQDEIVERRLATEEIVINTIHKYGIINGVML